MRFALGIATYVAMLLAPTLSANEVSSFPGRHHRHHHCRHGHHCRNGHHGRNGHHDVAQQQQQFNLVSLTGDATVSVLGHHEEAIRLSERLSREARAAAVTHAQFRPLLERVSVDARELERALRSRHDRARVRAFEVNLQRAVERLEEASRRHARRDAFVEIERTYRELVQVLRGF